MECLKFDTATEAEYPTLLCKRMADLLCSHLNLPLQTRPLSQHAEVSRSLGNHVTKPLIPEFFDIQLMTTDLPPNAKILTSHLQGVNAETEDNEMEVSEEVQEMETAGNTPTQTKRVGTKRFLSKVNGTWAPNAP